MVTKEKRSYQFLLFLFLSLSFIVILSGFAFAQTVILNQVPNQNTAFNSDPDFQQSIADNFVVNSTGNVTQIRIWGCYANNLASLTDRFTVIFHADSSGSPGTAISTQNNVPVVRQATGGIIAGSLTEYVYTLTLATPVNLTPGTYWVEIYNNAITGDFFLWESGTVDPTNGISGLAFANEVPGSTWYTTDPRDTAIEITQVIPDPVPTMTEWGMIIFLVLAGLGSVCYMRKQRRI